MVEAVLTGAVTSPTHADIPTTHTVNSIVNGTGYLKNNGSGTWTWVNETYSLSTHNHSGVYAPVNQTMYIGTTAVAINRSSGALVLTGITSISGSAATLTTGRTLTIGSTGKSFNGSADVSWTLDEIGATPKYAGIKTITASRNLATTDVNNVLIVSGTYALTIPSGTFTVGSQITIVRSGTGTVTITAGAGVYLNGVSAGSTTITTQWKAITLVCYIANYFVALGV
jgi:hypothetical protein